ncbi:MAG: leucyl/phenylalanyl-tRNA--protein transferase [Vicinamibacterales bacterium]
MIPSNLLLAAYASGWFPMADDEGQLSWYSPDPRGIIPLGAFHAPARLGRVIRRGLFRIQIDTVFEDVIRACAEAERDPVESGTWISEEIVESYCALHDLGYAHSVEAWQADALVGGLYGVALGGAFFGESMFHHVTDASKVALAALVDHLRSRGFLLLDTQWVTPHLEQFGAVEIPRSDYLELLERSLKVETSFP